MISYCNSISSRFSRRNQYFLLLTVFLVKNTAKPYIINNKEDKLILEQLII